LRPVDTNNRAHGWDGIDAKSGVTLNLTATTSAPLPPPKAEISFARKSRSY
jgi:hypothetical protein